VMKSLDPILISDEIGVVSISDEITRSDFD
jgi:hypothetical protein